MKREELKVNFFIGTPGMFYEKAEADKVMDALGAKIKELEARLNTKESEA